MTATARPVPARTPARIRAARSIAAGPIGIAILALEAALLGLWIVRLASVAVEYGNGRPLQRARLRDALAGLVAMVLLLIAQGAIMGS